MKNRPLIELLQQHGILKLGKFKLGSGSYSSYYCDIKDGLGNPLILNIFIRKLIPLIPTKATCIAASGYGGITLASLVAYKKQLPLVLVRDVVKSHGTKKEIDGYVPTHKDYVCIVDDVYTTGSSVNETKAKLAHLKCKFVTPVVIINRSNKNSVVSVLRDKDLMD